MPRRGSREAPSPPVTSQVSLKNCSTKVTALFAYVHTVPRSLRMNRALKISRAVAMLFVLWLFCVCDISAQGPVSKIGEYMDATVKAGKFSGSILVARGGKVLVSRGYRMANLE